MSSREDAKSLRFLICDRKGVLLAGMDEDGQDKDLRRFGELGFV